MLNKRCKYGLVLLLLFQLLIAAAQPAVMKELRQADSLMHIDKLAEADLLLKKVEALPSISISNRLQLQYLRGYFYNASEENTLAAKALLQLPEAAEREGLFGIAAEANIQLALVHEKTGDFNAALEHLNKAFHLLEKYGMDSLLGWYYVRASSFYRIKGQRDSALYFVKKGLPFAEKYRHLHALADSYLLLGILSRQKDPKTAAEYTKMALSYYARQQNYHGVMSMYNNLSKLYLNLGQPDNALHYNDSAVRLANYITIAGSFSNWLNRSAIYEYKNQYDSALFYYKQYSAGMLNELSKNEGKEIKKLTQQYESEKKDSIIRLNENRLLATAIVAALISITSLMLYHQNRKIKRQNKKINAQVFELNKLLQQKQILLSELQHRVKNNLQHILSLLDIQKESLSHNNIEEVIRETQYRVHSMALLHNKLSQNSDGDTVHFEAYLYEMVELIKLAYYNPQKQIDIAISCRIRQMPLDTALPLGLVIVELLSNSIKHAFINRSAGKIRIDISLDEEGRRTLTYKDDGKGFDYSHPPKEGIGLELVNGFLNEINATLHATNTHGTEIVIRF